jgi:hypothetical protein
MFFQSKQYIQWIIQAFHLIYAIIVIHISLCVMFQYIVDCVFVRKATLSCVSFNIVVVFLLFHNM